MTPFAAEDLTARTETELTTAVSSAADSVDLPERTCRFLPHAASSAARTRLGQWLGTNPDSVWERSCCYGKPLAEAAPWLR